MDASANEKKRVAQGDSSTMSNVRVTKLFVLLVYWAALLIVTAWLWLPTRISVGQTGQGWSYGPFRWLQVFESFNGVRSTRVNAPALLRTSLVTVLFVLIALVMMWWFMRFMEGRRVQARRSGATRRADRMERSADVEQQERTADPAVAHDCGDRPMPDTVTIQIPTPLRPQAGDNATVEVAGASVAEALKALTTQYPELGGRLFKSESGGGEVNRFINFYVNDEDIRFLDNLQTPLKPGDELSIVPAIAGG